MKVYQKITDLIGGTPLLELKNYEAAHDQIGRAHV